MCLLPPVCVSLPYVSLRGVYLSPYTSLPPYGSLPRPYPSPLYPFLVCIHLPYPFPVCISTPCMSISPVCIPLPYIFVSVKCILLSFVLIIEESQPNPNLSNDKNEKESLLTVYPYLLYPPLCVPLFPVYLSLLCTSHRCVCVQQIWPNVKLLDHAPRTRISAANSAAM